MCVWTEGRRIRSCKCQDDMRKFCSLCNLVYLHSGIDLVIFYIPRFHNLQPTIVDSEDPSFQCLTLCQTVIEPQVRTSCQRNRNFWHEC